MVFRCEGCGLRARDDLFPAKWTGYGTSRFKGAPDGIAAWCPTCRRNGTMKRQSRTTRRAALKASLEDQPR